MIDLVLPQRFWDKVEKTDTCWNWTGAKSPNGYGRFNLKNNTQPHRLTYEQFKGIISKGLQIDHLCKNTLCCNPTHLEIVTSKENNLRSNSITSINAKKTHCIHDHEFTSENTYNYSSGVRKCRKCHNLQEKTVEKKGGKYYMITHGILADKNWNITMKLILDHPEVKPNSETKDCWMDRRAYSLYQKKRMQVIYKERWK